MIGVALKGLLGRKLRAALTAFAIVLGVAMISGSFVLTDTLGQSFDGIYEESYKATDAVVSSKQAIKTGDGDTEAPAFSADVLHKIESLPGARVVQGSIEDEARLIDKAGNPIGTVDEGLALAVDASADQSLNPFQLVKGAWPSGDGQIAIDKATAEKQSFRIGQTVGVIADGPVARYRITGIVGFGSVDSIGGSSITVFDLPTAGRLFDKAGKLDLIRVGAEPGTTQAELVRQIRPLLSETTQVKSAEAQAAADSKDTQEGMSLIKYMLIGFGGIALFVGSFVIANTLAITVAQRMRELATLRTLGASRRQVLGSVVLESVVIGVVGSLAGLFLGLGIAVGLIKLLEATGIELPSSGLVFAPRTILVSLGVGTSIAVLASLRPAMRATRIEPIAAVREGSVMPGSRFARYAVLTSAVVFAAALGLFSYGVFASGLDIVVRIVALVLGVLLMFVSVAMIASRVVRPLALVLGTPGARLGARRREACPPERRAEPVPNRLDRGRGDDRARPDHLRRRDRPGRPHLVHGCGQRAVRRRLRTVGRLRLRLGQGGGSGGQNARRRRLRGSRQRRQARRQDDPRHRRRGQPEQGRQPDLVERIGRRSRPARQDGAFVTDRYADDNALELGAQLRVKSPTGTTLALRVEGILDEPKGGSPFGNGVAISKATFDGSFATRDNDLTLLNVDGGTNEANTAAIDA